MIYEVRVEDYKCEVEVAEDVVRINDEPVVVDLSTIGETNQYRMILNGVSHRMRAVKSGRGSWDIRFNGRKFRVDVLDCLGRAILEMKRSEHQVQRPRSLSAPMPGVVVSVEVELGDLVEAGQGLVIVEAMKMENEVKTETGGRVLGIHVARGDVVENGQVLVDLGSLEDEMT